jgi:hypothetical protein
LKRIRILKAAKEGQDIRPVVLFPIPSP